MGGVSVRTVILTCVARTGRQLNIAHYTAALWLAEIGVFADAAPALRRSDLGKAIEHEWPMAQIAKESGKEGLRRAAVRLRELSHDGGHVEVLPKRRDLAVRKLEH